MKILQKKTFKEFQKNTNQKHFNNNNETNETRRNPYKIYANHENL